ncbi:MAG: hypothetical protein HKO95_04760 [Rhodobacteraceae bacterium]|nr:hypothetical protein [Altererythrobacter sp.]NNK66027.1 hypothetical protein [Paracoccaceae bacterium]
MTRNFEELLFHMKAIARSSDEWAAGFARSILKQSKRPSWRPSTKQEAVMQRLVAERFTETEEVELIE